MKRQTHKFILLTIQKMERLLSGRGLSKLAPYYRKVREPIIDGLFRLLYPKTDVVEVQGSKMYVDLFHKDPAMRRTFRFYAIYREHEPVTTALFSKVVKEGDVVLDLGANIGYFTLLAAKLVKKSGRVYSFEPEPRNYGYLSKNISINGYDHAVAYNKAVADAHGTIKLFLCPYDTGHHTINQYAGIRSYNPQMAGEKEAFVEIEAVRLDDFFEGRLTPINVIKMDVEGAEMKALQGMEKIIRQNSHLTMFVEFFPLLIRKMGQSPEEFARRLLENYGFTMAVVADDYSMGASLSDDGLIHIDNVEKLMSLCQGQKDHLNLYLTK